MFRGSLCNIRIGDPYQARPLTEGFGGPGAAALDMELVVIIESDSSAPMLDFGDGEAAPSPVDSDRCETCAEGMENWSTQLPADVDKSVATPSLDDITETEPFSDRMSASGLRWLSTLDVMLDSDGGAACGGSMRSLGALEKDCSSCVTPSTSMSWRI